MVSWRSISAFNWIPSMEFFSPLFRQLPNFSGDSSPHQRVPDILNPIKNGQEHSKLIKANPRRLCPGTKPRFMERNKWDVIPGKESLVGRCPWQLFQRLLVPSPSGCVNLFIGNPNPSPLARNPWPGQRQRRLGLLCSPAWNPFFSHLDPSCLLILRDASSRAGGREGVCDVRTELFINQGLSIAHIPGLFS